MSTFARTMRLNITHQVRGGLRFGVIEGGGMNDRWCSYKANLDDNCVAALPLPDWTLTSGRLLERLSTFRA